MLVCFVLLIILFLIKVIFNIKLMHPHGMFVTLWLVFIAGSLLLLSNDYEFHFFGIIWIMSALILFCVGFGIVQYSFLMRKNEFVKCGFIPRIPWVLYIFFILIGFLGVGINALHYGIGLDTFSSFQSLQSASHNAAVQRYSGAETSSGVINQIFNTFIYILPLCAGYNWVYAETKLKKILCAVSFLPTFILMLITSAKLAIVAYVMLFFAGFYTSYLYKNKQLLKINFKKSIQYSLIGLGLFLMFVFSFILRIGTDEDNLLKLIISKLAIYAFGHIQGFDIWFKQMDYLTLDYGFGGNTFLAIASRFGFEKNEQGIYDILEGACTNVYTPFRGIIEDYGLVLGLVLVFLMGMLTSWFYMHVRYSRKKQLVSQLGLITLLFCVFYFIISPWTYTTYVFAFVVFAFYIFIAFRKEQR
ncbi:MAG: oligosaccharide repeat unit polymerase [Roseburia sp.]|nr:oligosaccharide repeat unit polymerase [Roseburia sp.]